MKRGGLGIPEPHLLVERAYNTSKSSSEVLVGSLLGGTNLNYVVHKGPVRQILLSRQHRLIQKLSLFLSVSTLPTYGTFMNYIVEVDTS